MEKLCDMFLTGAVVVLGICCFFCLVRSILGPRIADRIVAVNMIGTMTMMMIVILAVKMDEGFLVDVAIIYAMISFLAVVVLAKIYMGVYREKEENPPFHHPTEENHPPVERNRSTLDRRQDNDSLTAGKSNAGDAAASKEGI